MSDYTEKWRLLLATLEVTGNEELLGDDNNIRSFEKETKIILPAGFIEYCQVFGSGLHGDEFGIYCPCRNKSRWDLLTVGLQNLEWYKDAVNFEIEHALEGHPALDIDQMRSLEELLNNSFPFADNRFAETLLWDLRTYSEADRSYDIYRVDIDSLDEAVVVGRDFYTFVTEFIYEGKINGVVEVNSRYPTIEKIFYRIQVSD